jgi:hypothetical protein
MEIAISMKIGFPYYSQQRSTLLYFHGKDFEKFPVKLKTL